MGFGALRWQKQTTAFRAAMHSAQVHTATKAYNTIEIESLPAPVKRYFRAVLREDQAMVFALVNYKIARDQHRKQGLPSK